jgi:hypothetical protein
MSFVSSQQDIGFHLIAEEDLHGFHGHRHLVELQLDV